MKKKQESRHISQRNKGEKVEINGMGKSRTATQ